MISLLAIIRRLWTPILIKEGEPVPKWYGCSRWIPYDLKFKEPHRSDFEWVYIWQRIAYPMPALLVISFWYWLQWKLRRGFELPPQAYRSKVFNVHSHCPHCGADLYEFPSPR